MTTGIEHVRRSCTQYIHVVVTDEAIRRKVCRIDNHGHAGRDKYYSLEIRTVFCTFWQAGVALLVDRYLVRKRVLLGDPMGCNSGDRQKRLSWFWKSN